MITIKVTDTQAEIIQKCLQNYTDYLDKEIDKLEDESVKQYAVQRRANAKVATEVTSKAIHDWEHRPRSVGE